MNLPGEALRHAEDAYPNESCGLLYVQNGQERYYRCVNAAKDPSRDFMILPEEQLQVSAWGEIVAVVHSHPDAPADMSGVDSAMHRRHEMTSIIVSVERGKVVDVRTYEPDAGADRPLLDRPFVHGADDCYSLVRDYYARYHDLHLGDYARQDRWWEGSEELYLDNFAREGFEIIPLTEAKAGDALLMRLASKRVNHAAIWLENDMILHHLYGSLSRHDYLHHQYRQRIAYCVRHPAAGRPAWETWKEIW